MCNLNNYFNFQDFAIRDAVNDDTTDLVPLINQAYLYIESIRKKPRTSTLNLLEKFQENNYRVILNKNKIIGCFYLTVIGDKMHFGMFALLPEYRGIGLGKKVIGAIEGYSRLLKIKYIEIDRMSATPWLKKYYEDQGFVETGHVGKWDKIELIQMHKIIS